MSNDVRYSGQIASYWPATAPLELRLPQAVYDESSPMGPTSTGPGLSMPMGDTDSDFGDVVSTLSPGRPLRSARGPIGRVRPAPSVPSWVRTDRMLALQGCTGCSMGSDESLSNIGKVPKEVWGSAVAGAAAGYFLSKKTKRGASKARNVVGALLGFALGWKYLAPVVMSKTTTVTIPESPVAAQGGYVVI